MRLSILLSLIVKSSKGYNNYQKYTLKGAAAMKYIDMHVHTTASDGGLTPMEVVDYAIKKELAGIAITDHDTIDGLQEAIEYGNSKGLAVIAGVELSTEYGDEEIHILGYRIDITNRKLTDTLAILKNERSIRAAKIIERLRELYINITLDEVRAIAKEGVLGRPHVGQILIEKGIVKSIGEAFEKYLGKGCPAFVPRYKISPFEAIDLIKRAGGIAIMAHPGLVKGLNIMEDLISYGIDGIEAFHPDHTEEECCFFEKVARQNNLYVTGGSDFHHPPKTSVERSDLGEKSVDIEEVIEFFNC